MKKKLSQWAAENNYSYNGALKLFHRGGIPGAEQNPVTGTILVSETPVEVNTSNSPQRAAIYARVSTRKQQPHLDGQLRRMRSFASSSGYIIAHEVSEVASGMNENRKCLHSLLAKDDYDVLIVEYKDRLARFGSTWIEMILAAKGVEVVYMNTTDPGDDESLVDDLTSVIASFVGRLYGKRDAESKAKKAIKSLENE